MQNAMCEWSEREREVLDLIAKGRTNAEIATELGITFPTAKWYVSELISKLGVSSREEVADYWRHERGIGRRLQRALRALLAPVVLKAGAGVAGVAAVGAVSVAIVAAGGWGEDNQTQAAQQEIPTASATAQQVVTPPPYVPQPTAQVYHVASCDVAALAVFPPGPGQWSYQIESFNGCDMRGANLRSAMMNDVDFSGANLEGADLTGSTTGGADFTGANLRNVVALPGIFQNANFTNADLTGAHLSGAIVYSARFSNTTCPDGSNSNDHGGTCIGTPMLEDPPTTYSNEARRPAPGTCEHFPTIHNLPQNAYRCDRTMFPVLAGHTGPECDLRGLDLRYQYLDFAGLAGCNLAGVDLSYAQLAYADLTGANLQGANLSHTVMVATKLEDANLEGVNLDYAYVREAWMTDANLRGATTTGARLEVGWANATCPDGTRADDPAKAVKGCQ